MDKQKLNSYLNIRMTPELRERVEVEGAKRGHRNLAAFARFLIELGLKSLNGQHKNKSTP